MKKIISLLLVITILFSNNINVFANGIKKIEFKEIEIEDYIDYESKGDITSSFFTEIFYYKDGSKIIFEHYVEDDSKTIVVTDRDGTSDIVTYNNENSILTLNSQEVPYFGDEIEVYYSNDWFEAGVENKRYAVENFTKASLAAALAALAICPVNLILVVVAGAFYSTMWFSAEKTTYRCFNYNGSYKVGWYYETDIYADRNWSDHLYTYRTTEQSR